MALTINTKAIFDRLKKVTAPRELVAVDFSQSAVKCARLRAVNGDIQLLASDVLHNQQETTGADSKSLRRLVMPKHLQCRHAALCVPGKSAVLKLLSLPGQIDGSSEARIRDAMGVGGGEYRIGYKDLGHGHARQETKLLTAAVPETEIQYYLSFFSLGWPVPIAVELAGLTAVNAFIKGYLETCPDDSFGVIHFEKEVSFFAFFNKKELVLIRKFDFGVNNILSAIQGRLSVNHETAINVLSDQSFDISQMLKEVSDPFIRQLVISKHFVDRRENCRVTRIYIPGFSALSHRMGHEIHVASEVEVEEWDAFKAVSVQTGAIASRLAGHNAELASVIGAGIGVLGNTD